MRAKLSLIAVDFSQSPETSEGDSSKEEIEALPEMIWRAGGEPETKSAALLVLMASARRVNIYSRESQKTLSAVRRSGTQT